MSVNQQDVFASTQIISFNPILRETIDIRMNYFMFLRKMVRIVGWEKRKYTKAQMEFYREILCGDRNVPSSQRNTSLSPHFCWLFPYDLAAILGFNSKALKAEKVKLLIDTIICDFTLPKESADFLLTEMKAAFGDPLAWSCIFGSNEIKDFEPYLKLVERNVNFIKERPYNILITATMSAGKSTLINSLTGKNVSLMQNMACTSKIHTIISKPFEDHVTSEYDHDLSMNASREDLLSDNEANKSFKINVGTFFNGKLGGKRIVLFDSPGVNSSENTDHTQISHRMIKSRKYDLLLYVLNATQLATTDEEQHLAVVKKRLGRAKIIFVLNKADQLLSEDDSLPDAIESQRKFLISKGFQNPMICPISSRAAYLVKKCRSEELSRMERREMENLMDKFEWKSLSDYYEEQLACSHISYDNEEDALFVNSGFGYFEGIIANLYNGGRKNGTNLCKI